jgi:hypothetical protein
VAKAWLHKEVVTINGWKWADWSFVPMLKGKKDYRNSPVYSRNLTTSYKGQLLEINFTTNSTTDPALKDEIDKVMASVHLEEWRDVIYWRTAGFRGFDFGAADDLGASVALGEAAVGSAVPDCDCTSAMSELLIMPFTVTSSRKLL